MLGASLRNNPQIMNIPSTIKIKKPPISLRQKDPVSQNFLVAVNLFHEFGFVPRWRSKDDTDRLFRVEIREDSE